MKNVVLFNLEQIEENRDSESLFKTAGGNW